MTHPDESNRFAPRYGGPSALGHTRAFRAPERRAILRRAPRKVSVGDVEPPLLALVKHLLHPVVVVVALVLCALAYRQPLTAPYTVLATMAFIIAGQAFGEVDMNHRAGRRLVEVLGRGILLDWMIVVAVLLLLAFATKVSGVYSRKVILTWFVLTPVLLMAAQLLAGRGVEWLAARGTGMRSQLIVGANELGCELARKLRENPLLGTVQGFFDDRRPERLPDAKHAPLLGTLDDVADYVRRHSINVIYISLPISAEPRILRLLEELRDTTASIYFVPDIFVCDLIQARFVDVSGIPVVAVCETPFGGMNGVSKRASDIVLASLALFFAWPLMLAIAIGIKASSPGPVLFKQRRYGLDGEEIVVYKFRTMTVCEDGERVAQATRDDRRVTPFGGFLRRTSLDELPQILNVLQGKMSIVGPRPHAVAHNEQYRKLIRGYMVRHKVRPGITGWAQINGLRGETETVEKMAKRVEYDLDYLRNWSLWLDMKIIAKTALIVLRDRNAY